MSEAAQSWKVTTATAYHFPATSIPIPPVIAIIIRAIIVGPVIVGLVIVTSRIIAVIVMPVMPIPRIITVSVVIVISPVIGCVVSQGRSSLNTCHG